jgi:hypothetical protein
LIAEARLKKLLVSLVMLCAVGGVLGQEQAASGASQSGATATSAAGGASQGAGTASATTSTASAGAFLAIVGAAALAAVSSNDGDSTTTAPTHH